MPGMKWAYQSVPRHLSTGLQASLFRLEDLLDLNRGRVSRHNRLNKSEYNGPLLFFWWRGALKLTLKLCCWGMDVCL